MCAVETISVCGLDVLMQGVPILCQVPDSLSPPLALAPPIPSHLPLLSPSKQFGQTINKAVSGVSSLKYRDTAVNVLEQVCAWYACAVVVVGFSVRNG